MDQQLNSLTPKELSYIKTDSLKANFGHSPSTYNERDSFKWFKANKKDPSARNPQKRASQYAKLIGLGVPVISKQIVKDKGWREFCVLSWPSFYNKYQRMETRTYYEVIIDNAPCKLHIDVDMSLTASLYDDRDISKKIAQTRVKSLITIIIQYLKELFGSLAEVEDWIILDASKDDKFSQHVIFIFKNNNMFMNHSHVGIFLTFIYMMVEKNKAQWTDDKDVILNRKHPMLEDLLFKNEKGQLKFIADLAIYGGNREFRLLSSTKNGKNRWLNVIETLIRGTPKTTTSLKIQLPFIEMDKELFLDTIVCYLPKGRRISHLLKCDWAVSYAKLPKCVFILKTSKSKNINRQRALKRKRSIDENKKINSEFDESLQEYGLAASIYNSQDSASIDGEDLDEKTQSLFDRIGENIELKEGMIERGDTVTFKTLYLEDGVFCVIYISTSKWCEIKRDEHKSNHVFYVVWLRSKSYYQKCFDEECIIMEQRYLEESIRDKLKITDNREKKQSLTGDGEKENSGDDDDEQHCYNTASSTCRGMSKILDEELWKDINDFIKENEKQGEGNDANTISNQSSGTITTTTTALTQLPTNKNINTILCPSHPPNEKISTILCPSPSNKNINTILCPPPNKKRKCIENNAKQIILDDDNDDEIDDDMLLNMLFV